MNKITKSNKSPKDDAPTTDPIPSPELNISKEKVKKNKKKKKHSNKSESSVSSSNVSEVDSVPPLVIDEPAKEQFYDARESYHGLPENQLLADLAAAPAPAPAAAPAAPAIATTLLVAHSEHGQDPKTLTPTTPPSAATRQSAGRAKKAPSAVTKPVTGPQ